MLCTLHMIDRRFQHNCDIMNQSISHAIKELRFLTVNVQCSAVQEIIKCGRWVEYVTLG